MSVIHAQITKRCAVSDKKQTYATQKSWFKQKHYNLLNNIAHIAVKCANLNEHKTSDIIGLSKPNCYFISNGE